MKIIPQDYADDFVLYDKIIRKHLKQRAAEWKARSGWRRIFKRIQVHLWAWRQASLEMKKIPRKGPWTF